MYILFLYLGPLYGPRYVLLCVNIYPIERQSTVSHLVIILYEMIIEKTQFSHTA